MPVNHRSSDPIGIGEGFSPAEHYTPDQVERELIGELTQRFEESHRHRLQWEYSWEFNRLYLRGDQIVGRDRETGESTRIDARSTDLTRLFAVENLLRPNARALVGKLTRIIPGITVMPATDDESDLRAAEVAETFLEFIFRKESMRTKYLDAARALPWCGTSLFVPQWNKMGGRKLAWCDTCNYTGDEDEIGIECPSCKVQNQMKAEEANSAATQIYQQGIEHAAMVQGDMPDPPPLSEEQPAPILEKIFEGDVEIRRVDTRDFFPEPGVVDQKELRYFFIRKAYPVSEVRQRFPDMGKTVEAEEGLYTDRSLAFFGTLVDDRASTQYLNDHAYLYEFHEAPTAKHENGRIIYFTKDKILEETPHPIYKLIKRLPCFMQRFEINEGEFWGEPPINQAWHIQREHNRLLTQFREHRELTLKPKLLNPTGNRIGVDEIDTTPGQILPTSQFGRQPSWLEIPALPQYAYNELDRQERGIRLQFGITENEAGITAGDQSGRFAAIQESQSSESIAPVIVQNNAEFKELGRAVLLIAQRYCSKDFAWTVYGKERIRSYAWGDANMSPGWDLVMEESDSLSSNPAIRFQQANEMLNLGIFVDPRTGVQDTRTYMRVAGLKLPGSGGDSQASERAYAAQIPEMLARGEKIIPRPWDDPFIMVEELVGWLRGPGRQAPEPLVQMVSQWYMFYSQMLPYSPVDMHVTPNAAGGQMQGQQAGQGVGMGPGAQAGQAPGTPPVQQAGQSTVGQEAAQTVQNADAQGEKMARGSAKGHES